MNMSFFDKLKNPENNIIHDSGTICKRWDIDIDGILVSDNLRGVSSQKYQYFYWFEHLFMILFVYIFIHLFVLLFMPIIMLLWVGNLWHISDAPGRGIPGISFIPENRSRWIYFSSFPNACIGWRIVSIRGHARTVSRMHQVFLQRSHQVSNFLLFKQKKKNLEKNIFHSVFFSFNLNYFPDRIRY